MCYHRQGQAGEASHVPCLEVTQKYEETILHAYSLMSVQIPGNIHTVLLFANLEALFSFKTNEEASAAVFSCRDGTFPGFIVMQCIVLKRQKEEYEEITQ